MKIHEYQAKELLREFNVPVLDGRIAYSSAEALRVVQELKTEKVVVKAQIHAGGRGKGGGIILTANDDELQKAMDKLLFKRLITPQTGPEGQEVQRVYIESTCDTIKQEFYLALALDREHQGITIIASAQGGMEIEEVDHKHIFTTTINPLFGWNDFYARKTWSFLESDIPLNKFVPLLRGLYQVMNRYDATLVEINPLVLTQNNDLWALDCKMTFDDNALYRQERVMTFEDTTETNPSELEANRHGLNYVHLDGNIGCMVNGAGLAMATMDIIKQCGGKPANFLDVGGGASKEKVSAALKLILADEQVDTILINIFGGIMRCDIIAQGIVDAAKEISVNIPLVVRLQGTNQKAGKEILSSSGLRIVSKDNLEEAANTAVRLAKE